MRAVATTVRNGDTKTLSGFEREQESPTGEYLMRTSTFTL
jgi:hypothetical protein